MTTVLMGRKPFDAVTAESILNDGVPSLTSTT